MNEGQKNNVNGLNLRNAVKSVNAGEVRCPGCGRLLLKGVFGPNTVLDLRCPNNKCRFHKEGLNIVFRD